MNTNEKIVSSGVNERRLLRKSSPRWQAAFLVGKRGDGSPPISGRRSSDPFLSAGCARRRLVKATAMCARLPVAIDLVVFRGRRSGTESRSSQRMTFHFDLPSMPLHESDWFRPVQDAPVERLTK